MGLAAGIDFGGTSAKMGLVEEDGRICCKTSVPLELSIVFEQVVEKVSDGLRGLLSAAKKPITTIGIGTPGFIDKHEGVVIGGSENIPSMQGHSIQNELSRIFGVPAFAENDATAAAAGELIYGAGRRFSNFVLITLGTAIGGGFVFDGHVYRGWRGFAGEVGHICVVPDGLWCNCGSRGCFEQYASGKSIAELYASKLRKRGRDGAVEVTAKLVVDGALRDDPLAIDTLEEAGRWIAQAFGTMLNVLDLEACLVGGGVSEAGDILLEPIRRRLPDFCWRTIVDGVQVVAAELRNDAGILGAAAQAVERMGA